jgi:hypothetical protein
MARAVGIAAKDMASGFFLVTHNAMALVGLAVLALALTAYSRPDVRQQAEAWAFGWLQERHDARDGDELAEGEEDVVLADASGVDRATATDPNDLTQQQAAVARWISRRYKVAQEPIGRLVQEAWDVGARFKVEPTVILAIMAVESSFNPFAQSSVGAQGLMQVMTRVHDKKYEAFGGTFAAFDPVSNLRVGVQVLKECIRRGGSLEEGLRHYVGAANLEHDGGYASKVLSEHDNLQRVAAGKSVPTTVPLAAIPRPAPQRSQAADAKTAADAAQEVPATDVKPAPVTADGERTAKLSTEVRVALMR